MIETFIKKPEIVQVMFINLSDNEILSKVREFVSEGLSRAKVVENQEIGYSFLELKFIDEVVTVHDMNYLVKAENKIFREMTAEDYMEDKCRTIKDKLEILRAFCKSCLIRTNNEPTIRK